MATTRRTARSRRATGVHDHAVLESPWISSTPGPDAAPVEEVDAVARRDLDDEPGRLGGGIGRRHRQHRP